MKTTENEMDNDERYTAQGYKDRNDYLTSLAGDYGIDMPAVRMIAGILGPSEDFDALVSELEYFQSMGLCDSNDENFE